MNIQELAAEAAGNWRKFPSFGWHPQPEDADKWTIVYTNNRDADLLTQSNAKAIDERIMSFEDDVLAECHRHWACGWVEGYAIRVYNPDGTVSKAFEEWCAIQEELENYPVLDEDEFSQREHDATWENLESVVSRVWRYSDREGDQPEDLTQQVWDYLWENDQRQLDSVDGQGGYPSEESVENALVELGYPQPEEIEG